MGAAAPWGAPVGTRGGSEIPSEDKQKKKVKKKKSNQYLKIITIKSNLFFNHRYIIFNNLFKLKFALFSRSPFSEGI